MRPLRLRAAVRAAVEVLGPSADDGSPEALVQLVDLALRVNQPVAPARLAKAAATARLGRDGGLALRLARAAAQATGALGDVRRWADLAYEHGDDAGLAAAVHRLRQAAATGDDEAAVAAGLAEAEQAFWRDADTHRALAALDRAARRTARRRGAGGSRTGARRVGPGRRRHGDRGPTRRGRTTRVGTSPSGGGARPRPPAAGNAVDRGRDHRRRPGPAPDADDTVLLGQSPGAGRGTGARARRGRPVVGRDERGDRGLCPLRALRRPIGPGHLEPRARRGRGRARARRTRRGPGRPGPDPARRAPPARGWALGAGRARPRRRAGRRRGHRDRGGVPSWPAALPHPATLFSLVESRAVALAAAFSRPGLARDGLAAAARALFAAGDVGAGVVTVHELAVAGAAGEPLGSSPRWTGSTSSGPIRDLRCGSDTSRPWRVATSTGLDALADEFAERGGDRWAVECVTAGAALAAERGDAHVARRRFGDALALLERCGGPRSSPRRSPRWRRPDWPRQASPSTSAGANARSRRSSARAGRAGRSRPRS